MLRAATTCAFSTSQLPKWSETVSFLRPLTSKCASRNDVCFLNISNSKTALNLQCFEQIHFQTCLAPQRRFFLNSLTLTCASRQQALAFFPRLNFQKRSDAEVFFWKSASRHNGVRFLIAELTRWLRTRRFSEPTFRPSGATKYWINTLFCDFSTFSRAPASSFFWVFLFSDLLSSSFLFCDCSHLCF